MTWPIGWSWTQGRMEMTGDPDGKQRPMGVHGGPFFFNPRLFGRVYVYAGFRPTPPWSPGFGDEGPWWWVPVAQWLKRKGFGNFGIALRRVR